MSFQTSLFLSRPLLALTLTALCLLGSLTPCLPPAAHLALHAPGRRSRLSRLNTSAAPHPASVPVLSASPDSSLPAACPPLASFAER